ncbi:hypothetical protein PAPYR_5771 [Paratrimastix pyriformis]|uniref:Uncharacterized protein n=1 Tax=Paratrimastix pyriformis TaxID=342808 RepID=A0ABQ8ULI2_9EUKA|nr:hypothetical protein PAPYR_5771 [Paratrimastix pyriformis]
MEVFQTIFGGRPWRFVIVASWFLVTAAAFLKARKLFLPILLAASVATYYLWKLEDIVDTKLTNRALAKKITRKPDETPVPMNMAGISHDEHGPVAPTAVSGTQSS